jgi:ketosteroid isomerase-like protein
MSDRDVELAREFLDALAVAAKTGEADAVYPLLAQDVEWRTPQLDLRSIGEVQERMEWLSPGEHLELEFGEPELTDLGSGRIVTDVHEIYRMKRTGDFAYARDRQIEVTVREGKIARYELRFVGS